MKKFMLTIALVLMLTACGAETTATEVPSPIEDLVTTEAEEVTETNDAEEAETEAEEVTEEDTEE